jgi:hypothetical protein
VLRKKGKGHQVLIIHDSTDPAWEYEDQRCGFSGGCELAPARATERFALSRHQIPNYPSHLKSPVAR